MAAYLGLVNGGREAVWGAASQGRGTRSPLTTPMGTATAAVTDPFHFDFQIKILIAAVGVRIRILIYVSACMSYWLSQKSLHIFLTD